MFTIVSIMSFLCPPFLAFFVWRNFLRSSNTPDRPRWKTVLDWIALLSVSGLFVVCLIAFFTIPCNVDRVGWACVAKWRAFSVYVIRTAPGFVTLAAIGRKGTRILSILWILAVNFDCVLVDMMA